MYDSVEDFLMKIENEGLDYALDGYGLRSADCPPGEVRDAWETLERLNNSQEFKNARRTIEKAIEKLYMEDIE